MNLPTDTDLEKRADDLTAEAYLRPTKPVMGKEKDLAWLGGMEEATLEALRIDRESYLLLKECEDRLYVAGTYAPAGLMSHLTTLRTRLGITE